MKTINVKETLDIELGLYKPNREIIGVLSNIKITSIAKSIDDIDSISFEINSHVIDRFSRNLVKNAIYDEIRDERLICLNESEYYVIKSIEESFGDKTSKVVNAVSLEHKLTRVKVVLEDIGMVLVKEDIEESELAILDLLYSETGWAVGYVDEGVRFNIDEEGNKKVKVRWQDSVNDSWYSLLTETIADTFGCIIEFDTYNKMINLYDMESYGENIGLYLSKDNYIKSIEKSSSTDNIVTRLSLTGKDEMDIRDVNPLGKDYIEDYSYFIENNDMSIELQKALELHTKIIEKNHIRWKELSDKKSVSNKELIKKKSDFFVICEEIKVLMSMKEVYESQNDSVNAEIIQGQIDEKNIIKESLEEEVRKLELDILEINTEIDSINTQLDRANATDENGDLIFTKKILDELNEFLYYETYSNTAYLTSAELMEGGKKELINLSKPTIEYTIDSVNLLRRVINNQDESFKGQLSLGDIIILYDDAYDKETLMYFVGYECSPSDNKLDISLSNKKSKINNSKSIADYLKKAESTKKFINNKAYMFNQIKYNKI